MKREDPADPENATPSEPETGSAPVDRIAQIDTHLAALRADTRNRRIATGLALGTGLLLAWIHWVGLVLAGALVGIPRRRLRSAVASGLGVGVLCILLTVSLSSFLSASEFLALTPVNYLTIGLGLILPAWGSLARYVL